MATWFGLVYTAMDAMTPFEACLLGRLGYIPHRPHDREREGLIQSGHALIYEEHAYDIER
jgi:hypothetical protein